MAATVLIVDDHASFRRMARRLLASAGYSVVGEAENGAAALAAVDRLEPDIVLLDVLLPDLNGLAVADSLARRPSSPHVLLISSRSATDYGASLGGRPFLPKNELTPRRLAAALEEMA